MPTDPTPDIDAGVAGPSEAAWRGWRCGCDRGPGGDPRPDRRLRAGRRQRRSRRGCRPWRPMRWFIDGFGIVEGPADIAAILEGAHHQQLTAGGAALCEARLPSPCPRHGDGGWLCVPSHRRRVRGAPGRRRWTLVRADTSGGSPAANRLLNARRGARASAPEFRALRRPEVPRAGVAGRGEGYAQHRSSRPDNTRTRQQHTGTTDRRGVATLRARDSMTGSAALATEGCRYIEVWSVPATGVVGPAWGDGPDRVWHLCRSFCEASACSPGHPRQVGADQEAL